MIKHGYDQPTVCCWPLGRYFKKEKKTYLTNKKKMLQTFFWLGKAIAISTRGISLGICNTPPPPRARVNMLSRGPRIRSGAPACNNQKLFKGEMFKVCTTLKRQRFKQHTTQVWSRGEVNLFQQYSLCSFVATHSTAHTDDHHLWAICNCQVGLSR